METRITRTAPAYMIRALWALTILVTAAVGLATLTPIERPPLVPSDDKVQHFIAFALLALPLSWAYPRHAWKVALAAIAYGGAIEIVQPYMNRGRELGDFIADAAGAGAGAAFASWLRGRFSRSA